MTNELCGPILEGRLFLGAGCDRRSSVHGEPNGATRCASIAVVATALFLAAAHSWQ
jgi:hypothetical protein